jgi:hypothetical protein
MDEALKEFGVKIPSEFKLNSLEEGGQTGVHCATMSLDDVNKVLLSPKMKIENLFQYYVDSKFKGLNEKYQSLDYVERAWVNAEKAMNTQIPSTSISSTKGEKKAA